MKKTLLFLLVSLILFTGFQGCKKSPTGSEGKDTDEIKISEKTEVLGDSTISKIDHESGDSVIYFTKNAQEILQLEDGDIIVSSDGEGFLRKVKETKKEGNYIIVKTEYAALEDAIEKGNLTISNKTLNFNEMRTTSKLRGVNFKPRGDLLEVDFNSLIYEDPTTGAKIRGVGKSVFGVVIDTVGAEFSFGLQSFIFGLKVYHSESLGVEITKGCSFEGKIKLASFALTPILVYVGIPIVITPHVDLYIGANLNVQASVSTSVQKDDTIMGGIIYSKAQGWSTFSDYKKSFSYSPPSVSLSGEAKVYAVVPEISLQIYELIGPYAQMEGYGRIEVNPLSDPWWTLYAGVDVSGGVEFEVLAWNVKWGGSIYSNEWEIANDSKKVLGLHWNGTEEFLVSMNLATGQIDYIGTLTGVESISAGESTFDPNNGRYIISTNLGITIIDIQTGNILNSFPTTISIECIEYDPVSSKLYGLHWNGTEEFLVSMNLSTGQIDYIGTLTGVKSIGAFESTFDPNNGRYIISTNLGITIIDIQTGNILNSFPTTISIECIEYPFTP